MNDNSTSKATEFRKVLRGYDPAEVSAYIDQLKKQLSASRRKSEELEEKLKAVMFRFDEVDTKGEELEEALANIDSTREQVMSEAHRRSAAMLDDTRKRCAEAEKEMREGIARQRDAFVRMHELILSFRSDLFSKYNAQIESIDSIASLADAYDETMMYCMKKNGLEDVLASAEKAEPPIADKAVDVPSDGAADAAGETDADDTPAHDGAGYETVENETSADDAANDTPIYETAGEDHIGDGEIPADGAPEEMPSDAADEVGAEDEVGTYTGESSDVTQTAAKSYDYFAADAAESADEADDDDYSPVDGKYVAEDYSFDENSVPHMSTADRIIAEETPRVTRDDLPKDFDIYHASGDQLLELIYGKGPAKTSSSDDGAGDDPLAGVDYTFGDD